MTTNSLPIHERERGRVRLYACGGAGINMGSKIAHFKSDASECFAKLDTIFVDTSKSNLNAKIEDESVYLIKSPDGEEKDGSGQQRKENYDDISAQTRDILQKFKPADLNIVMSSTGGGSGAVIGSCIVSELLAKDQSVIVVCVGDDSTKTFAENTIKTIKTYEHIAMNTREKPVVMFYIQNSVEMTRAIVDERVQSLVASLCMLYSKRNRELDSKDLYNWLNFQNVTSHEPNLVALTLVNSLNPETLGKLGNLISIATLTTDQVDPMLPIRPEVQFVGIVDDAGASFKAPYHYVTSDGIFSDVVTKINGVLKEIAEKTEARVKKSRLSSNATLADNGDVFL